MILAIEQNLLKLRQVVTQYSYQQQTVGEAIGYLEVLVQILKDKEIK